jgi:hypothetical protein
MAKKTTKKKPATKATPKASAAKAPAAKATKKASPLQAEHADIVLDPIEIKAIKLAHSSDKVQKQLEEAASLAMSQAVRKVFKQHRISLTPPQSQEVTAVLFGD